MSSVSTKRMEAALRELLQGYVLEAREVANRAILSGYPIEQASTYVCHQLHKTVTLRDVWSEFRRAAQADSCGALLDELTAAENELVYLAFGYQSDCRRRFRDWHISALRRVAPDEAR